MRAIAALGVCLITTLSACSNPAPPRSAASPHAVSPRTAVAMATPSAVEASQPVPAPTPSPTPTELQRRAAATALLVAPTPGALNSRLVAAYATLRDRNGPVGRRTQAARGIQLASSQLLYRRDWRPGALAALNPPDRASLQAIIDAGDELTELGGEVSGTPRWLIEAPQPASTLISHYQEGQSAYGIQWQYLAAINFVETAMGRIHGLSVAGAQGPMQFMPGTWAAYGRGDVNDPRAAILAAARYLRASGGPGNMDSALYSYNNSQRYVRAVKIFADQVATDPDGYFLYYSWDVMVPTTTGPAILPEGWTSG